MYKEISNKRFGSLVAISPTENRQQRSIIWLCKCDCGNNYYAPSGQLVIGNRTHCGCKYFKKLPGKKFYKLTLCTKLPKGFWWCLCDCGNWTKVGKNNIGYIQSCGCQKLNNKGPNHHFWNPNLSDKDRQQRDNDPKEISWAKEVKIRDNFTCQKCYNKGGNLESHHIFNYSTFIDLRYKLSNGITLCTECHKNFHKKYGFKGNNREQINDYLKVNII